MVSSFCLLSDEVLIFCRPLIAWTEAVGWATGRVCDLWKKFVLQHSPVRGSGLRGVLWIKCAALV